MNLDDISASIKKFIDTPKEFTTKNEAEVVIAPAKFSQASKLRRLVAQELVNINIDAPDADLRNLSVNAVKNCLLKITNSEAIENCVLKCLERSSYDGQKITAQLFEDNEQAVADYYELFTKGLIINLRPFFRSQVLGLLATIQEPKNSQK